MDNIDLKFEYSAEKFKVLFDLSPVGTAIIDYETGIFLEFNQSLLNSTSYTKEEFKKLSFWKMSSNNDEIQNKKELKETNTLCSSQKEYIKKDGTFYPVKISGSLLSKSNEKNLVLVFIEDISLNKEYEIIFNDSRELLGYVAIENNLQNTLDKIIDFAEKRNPFSMCSILLLDKSKKHLKKGSAPSLPDFYNEAINGIEIGDKVGSCGSAAFNKKRVIIDSIDTHENWQAYLGLTNKANLHACWSEPIISSSNEVLGTFAIYYSKAKKPSEFELKIIENFANIASKAIEKYHYNKNIKDNEYKMEQFFNSSQSGLLYIDENRKLIKANQRFADILGYDSPDELLGFSMEKFHLSHKNFIEFGKNNFTTLIKEREKFNISYELKRKDGTSIWCDLSGKALDSNIPVDLSKGVLWTVHDLTEIRQRENELKKLNELAQSLTKSQQILLSLFDKGDSVLFKWKNNQVWSVDYVSLSVFKLLGFSKEEILSSKIKYEDCINKDDLLRVQSEVENALVEKLDYFKHEPYRITTKSGEEKWILDYTVTQKDDNGNITHFIGYLTDISEQIKNQEMIFHQSKIASLGEMLGNISHQWRQPLSVISTAATGIEFKKELGLLEDDEIIYNMRSINENAQYLSKTIDDFRNFFLGDTNIKSEVCLRDCIEKVLILIQDTFKNLNIDIVKNIDKELFFTCNENLLIQALINLFNNAKDALVQIKQSSSKRYIFIDIYKENNISKIAITDNANGIEEKYLEKVFEPYFTTKHKSQGTGIGLYMTNQIITKHLKSEIKVKNIEYLYENIKYKGAKFIINLSKS